MVEWLQGSPWNSRGGDLRGQESKFVSNVMGTISVVALSSKPLFLTAISTRVCNFRIGFQVLCSLLGPHVTGSQPCPVDLPQGPPLNQAGGPRMAHTQHWTNSLHRRHERLSKSPFQPLSHSFPYSSHRLQLRRR